MQPEPEEFEGEVNIGGKFTARAKVICRDLSRTLVHSGLVLALIVLSGGAAVAMANHNRE